MPILTQMRESSESLEPMKIGGSAFSRRAKQAEMAELGVPRKGVSLGALPRGHIASQQRYIGGDARQ